MRLERERLKGGECCSLPSPSWPPESSNFANSTNYLQDNTFVTATNYIHNAGPSKRPFDCKHEFSYLLARIQNRALDLLENICVDAVHNSAARCDAPKCHPETRKAVQEDILSWIRTDNEDEQGWRILFITGPAGTGKTAIAGSVAETCDDEGLLAGSFFFSSFMGKGARNNPSWRHWYTCCCSIQHCNHFVDMSYPRSSAILPYSKGD